MLNERADLFRFSKGLCRNIPDALMSPANSMEKPNQTLSISAQHFLYVDALRGIAALLVILLHTAQHVKPYTAFHKLGVYGQYGVQLFFVISAFTLCHSMNKLPGVSLKEYKKFLLRRFFRIAPLYYLALFAYWSYTFIIFSNTGNSPWTLPSDFTFSGVISNVFFLHNPLFYQNSIVPGGWSIGCEFLFYAAFPLLFFVFKRSLWKITIFILFGLAATLATPAIYTFLGYGYLGANDLFRYFLITNQIPCFAFGMLYFFKRDSREFNTWIAFSVVPAAVGLAIWHRYSPAWMLTPICAALLSTRLALVSEGIAFPRWLMRIGELSFSMYINHFIVVWSVFMILNRFIPKSLNYSLSSVLIFMIIISITIIFSHFTNKWIEKPCIELGRKLGTKMFKPSGNFG